MARFGNAASLLLAAALAAGCTSSESVLGPSPELLQIQAAMTAVRVLEASEPALLPADKWEDVMAKFATAAEELAKTPPDQEAAVGNLEGAVGDLETGFQLPDLDAQVESDLRSLLDDLVVLARDLAYTALDAATSRDGDAQSIAEAERSLREGDELWDAGAYKDAVNKFKDGLAKARSS